MARLATSETPFWRHAFEDRALVIQDTPRVTFKPKAVFVLMEMTSNESDAVYRAIKNGCRAVDLAATRVDEKPGATVIMRDVDELMGHAEFLVFDLTGERPNVYYELGYAHGIGNHATNILLVAREGTRIHFDVAPLRIYFYRSLEHLQSMVSAQLGELKREHVRSSTSPEMSKYTARPTQAARNLSDQAKRPWWKFW